MPRHRLPYAEAGAGDRVQSGIPVRKSKESVNSGKDDSSDEYYEYSYATVSTPLVERPYFTLPRARSKTEATGGPAVSPRPVGHVPPTPARGEWSGDIQ